MANPFRQFVTQATLVVLTLGLAPSWVTADAQSADYQSVALQPLQHIDATDRTHFEEGKSEFAARWVPPFVSGGHWGRGPHSNAASCDECHRDSGNGHAPDDTSEEPHALVLRLSLQERNADTGPVPHPVYGTQLNRHGVAGTLIEEGDFRVGWQTHEITLADGEQVELRKPVVHVTALWFGPIGKQTVQSLRLAQPVYGLGLLEAIPESTLQHIARKQRDAGLNGRINYVRDVVAGTTVVGRFGHKAMHPSIRQQVAAAFLDEMGVTSSVFPDDSCAPIQTECAQLERLSTIEARDEQLLAIVDYLRMLAPPPRRGVDDAQVVRGEDLFAQAGCAACHVPEMSTSAAAALPALRNRVIHPYSDLLLHDMGDGLADGRKEYAAGGRDWRTPPLWGLGLRNQTGFGASLLHDGRARTISEAILWHGGEADSARRKFASMPRDRRADLLRFLDSL